MTEISEAAKRKAVELINEAAGYNYAHMRDMEDPCPVATALLDTIQEHSDVAKKMDTRCFEDSEWHGYLQTLILPGEPDSLADLRAVLKEMTLEMPQGPWPENLIKRVSDGLATRGKRLKIVEAEGDD